MAKKELSTLSDTNGNSMQWHRTLVPRLNSGVKDEINIVMHFTIKQCNAIFKSIGQAYSNEDDFKAGLLKSHGYVEPVENVSADTTPTKDSYIAQLKTAIETAHKQDKKVTEEQLNSVIKNQLKVPDTLQTQVFNAVKNLCDKVELF